MKTFKQYLNESVHDHLDHFVSFASNHLGLDNPPKIELVDDKEHAQENASFGGYSPSDHSIKVNIAGRHTADVFRTLAHELVHHKQNLDNRIQHDSGATGSDIENEANSQAGVIMRNYAKANRAIFEARKPVSTAKVGDYLRIGFEGSRTKHLDQVKHITPSGQVKTHDKVFDPKTGYLKGNRHTGKIFAQKAKDKDLDDEFRNRAVSAIQKHDFTKHSTDELKNMLKHIKTSIFHHKSGKYTSVDEARRKPQNPADYPHVQNALAGRKRKVMFSADKPEKKTRKGRVRWHIEKM